jgi:hypothetical protein
MSLPEWVDPLKAVYLLTNLWKIPSGIAEDIVWATMQSGEVPIRGVPAGSPALQIITKEISASMRRGSLIILGFRDVEIEGAGLLQYGRNLIPSWCAATRDEPKRRLNAATAKKFAANYIAAEKAAGRHPTMQGLEQAAADEKMHGAREHLRQEFRRIQRDKVRVGRPRSKHAKK